MNQLRSINKDSQGLQDGDLAQVIGDSRGVGELDHSTHLNNIGINSITHRGVGVLARHRWDNLTYFDLGKQ